MTEQKLAGQKTGQQVVVSGMRPTGRLHLGHYFGVLQNWVALQDDYNCYFFIADWHALTTEYADPSVLRSAVKDILLDWLAVGLDPKKAVLFLQSRVPEHAELSLLLGMITPLSWLERVPSYKELKQELKEKDLSTYGFLGYPLLQTADVVIYDAEKVPVGQDQLAHLELSREIVRRFNHLYGDVLKEPQSLLTPAAKVPGLDGRKMSKSYGNSVFLSESAEEVQKKLMTCLTDPARVRRSDPGDPSKCTLYSYHELFSTAEQQSEIAAACRKAEIGCVDCKKRAISEVNCFMEPLRERRTELAAEKTLLDEILEQGAARARSVAAEHLQKIYVAMGLAS